MDKAEQGQGSPRRITRRSRSGFAFSSASISDSTASDGGSNINAHVERAALRPVSSIPARDPIPALSAPSDTTPPTPDDFNPRDRLTQVRTRAAGYEREYRLNLLNRLLMRGVPIDEIATQLGLSISQVNRDRAELGERLRADARGLNIDSLIGDSKAFYEEAAAMSMRAASASNLPMPIRLAAVRTALASKNDMHRFMQTAGVYDVLRFRLAADGTGVSDVRQLMMNTERILSGQQPDFSTPENSGNEEHIEL